MDLAIAIGAVALVAAHLLHLGSALVALGRQARSRQPPKSQKPIPACRIRDASASPTGEAADAGRRERHIEVSNPPGESDHSVETARPFRPPVSILIPANLVDHLPERTLGSAFKIDYPDYELIFCVPSDADPSVRVIRSLMAMHDHVAARLLIGRDRFSSNPKLDNIEKGWGEAHHDWIIIADSNVVLPPDFVERLFDARTPTAGLVSSVPVGTDARSFWAEVECAFLNTYQARLQLTADWLGFGFAHGKTMLVQRSSITPDGDISALGCDVAEDSAATKVVRSQGRDVVLTDRPLEQPLGARSLRVVWSRQLRWAQLRRNSFPWLFAGEILTTSLVPTLAAAGLAHQGGWGWEPAAAGAASLGLWLAVEAGLAKGAGWPMGWRYLPACVCRDVAIALIWPIAWFRRDYLWRGNHVDLKKGTAGAGDRR